MRLDDEWRLFGMAVVSRILAWVSIIGNAAWDTVILYAALCYISDRRNKRGGDDSRYGTARDV